jgi:hypothetical protein
LIEQLAADRRDAVEMVRAEGAFKVSRGAAGFDAGRKAGRIHLIDGRAPDEIGIGLCEFRQISGFIARIARQIFMRRELRRIDENGDDRFVGVLLGVLNECEMSGMQRSHRRNQRNGLAGGPPVGRDGS